MRELIPFVFILACPLMMVFMMRGMHSGHAGHDAGEPVETTPRERMSIEQLKRERDELNQLIGDRAEQIAHTRNAPYAGRNTR
jgi:hypothetical protein